VRRPWPPIPDPDPGPIFEIDPGVIDPSPIAIAQMNLPAAARIANPRSKLDAVALNPQPLPPREMAMSHSMSAADQVMFNPQPDPPGVLALAELTVEMRSALISPSTTIVREALASNIALLRPYLCLWPWLWHYYRCDELAVVYTNHQGRFDTTIFWFTLSFRGADSWRRILMRSCRIAKLDFLLRSRKVRVNHIMERDMRKHRR
jgi:hypothetical protein